MQSPYLTLSEADGYSQLSWRKISVTTAGKQRPPPPRHGPSMLSEHWEAARAEAQQGMHYAVVTNEPYPIQLLLINYNLPFQC